MRRSAVLSVTVVAFALLAAGCTGVSHEGPTTLAEAKALAAERGVPVLLDFYTDW